MEKRSYGDCKSCPLYSQSRVVGDTNCKDDLSKVEVLVLAEAPSHEEIKQNKPLVGPAGKIFRAAFEKSKLNTIPYYISNVVLCANIQENGKTDNPPQEAIDSCAANWKKLIDLTKPKVIVTMGTIPMRALGIADSGILKLNGTMHKYENYNVFVLVHPSYVMRNGGLDSEQGVIFCNDFIRLAKALKVYDIESSESTPSAPPPDPPPTEPEITEDEGGDGSDVEETETEIIKDLEKPYTFKLPSWCYSIDVCLVDIQYIRGTNSILYVFRDKDGNKRFHQESSDERYYYIGKDTVLEDAPMIANVSDVYLVKTSVYAREFEKSTYEYDVRPELKHSIDYRIERGDTPECDAELIKMFCDIEVYSGGSREFPDPTVAPSPINAISFQVNSGDVNVWVVKLPQMDASEINPITEIKTNIRVFDSELELLEAFFKEVNRINPDLLLGWNFLGFDIITIYNRAKRYNLDISKMSPVGISRIINGMYGEVHIYGMHVACLLDLYKDLTYTSEESYKLDYISQKVLGKGKVAYEGTLDKLYETNINKFIEYSSVDTQRLSELDKALGHVDLRYEMIRACASTWTAGRTTMGQIDPLCISYAKKMGLVCRTALERAEDESEESIPGAYVRNPTPGHHGYVIDLDFTSLYPSIICTFNIGPNTFVGKIDPGLAKGIIYFRNKLNKNMEIEYIENPIKKNYTVKKMKCGDFLEHVDKNKYIVSISGAIYKNHDEEFSFFEKIVSFILTSRREYNRLLNEALLNGEEDKAKQLDNKQLAYKILVNSLYGVLANANFRMFNKDMASTITLTGQESIKFVGLHLNNYLENNRTDIDPSFLFDYENKKLKYLIYTDTDSVFIAMGDYLADKKIIEM